MAEGHREAAPRVLDGREHDGTLAAEGRPLTTRHIAVYPRILTAANTLVLKSQMPSCGGLSGDAPAKREAVPSSRIIMKNRCPSPTEAVQVWYLARLSNGEVCHVACSTTRYGNPTPGAASVASRS